MSKQQIKKNEELMLWGRTTLWFLEHGIDDSPFNFIDALIHKWPELNINTQLMIRADVENAFDHDDLDRQISVRPHDRYSLGTVNERRQWERVRNLWLHKRSMSI